MVNHISLNRPVGELEDRKYRDDFFRDSVSGSISGPGVETEFVTPSFQRGEVWELRIQVSLSSENTSDIIVVRLMDEDETDVIVRTVHDTYSKNHFEMKAIVTAEEANFEAGSGSPDLQIEAVGSDIFNYFITCRGIRLRRSSDVSDNTSGETTRPPDDVNFNVK